MATAVAFVLLFNVQLTWWGAALVGLFGGLFWVASRRAARGQEEASSGGPEDHA